MNESAISPQGGPGPWERLANLHDYLLEAGLSEQAS